MLLSLYRISISDTEYFLVTGVLLEPQLIHLLMRESIVRVLNLYRKATSDFGRRCKC